jgi:hypothetical protein
MIYDLMRCSTQALKVSVKTTHVLLDRVPIAVAAFRLRFLSASSKQQTVLGRTRIIIGSF